MNKSKILKPTVLSISLLTVLSGAAVSPALAQIQKAFPDASDLAIQMILTLPPLLIIPFSLFSGWLALRFQKRSLLFVGLTFYLAAGVGGGFANSIPILLVLRALLGIGTGLIAPLSQSLIADFFTGDERADMMGKSSAVATLGGIVMPLLSGWLAVYNWRFAFGAYLISIFVFFMVWRFLPEPPMVEKQDKKVGKLPVGVYGLVFLTFMLMVVFYLIPTKAALFMQENQIGNAGQVGLVIAVLNVAAFLVGMRFGWLRKLMGNFVPLFGLTTLSFGLLILYFAENLLVVLVAMFIAGLGIGTLMPTIFLTTANLVPAEMNAPALSGINGALYLGQFASPLVFSLIGVVFSLEGVRFDFFSGAVMAGVAAVVFFGVGIIRFGKDSLSKEK